MIPLYNLGIAFESFPTEVMSIHIMEEQLMAEGFELVPSKRSKGEYRVVDYKKYLYDFEKECSLVLEDFIKYKLDRDIL